MTGGPPLAKPGAEFLVAYSDDKAAVEALREAQNRAYALPFWKRKDKAAARADAAAARARCIDAGVDWEKVPKPPEGFSAPERSERPRIGRVATAEPTAVAAPALSGAQANGTGNGIATAGVGFAGGLAGAAAFQWLQAERVHQGGDGSSVLESVDGSYWYADPAGNLFGLADDGSWLAADPEGTLWALSSAGDYVTWAADGTVVSLADNGSLVAFTDQGDALTLGEDGSFYFSGADGDFYTLGADEAFYGVDEAGNYFSAPDGSGFSPGELDVAAFDGDGDFGDGWELF